MIESFEGISEDFGHETLIASIIAIGPTFFNVALSTLMRPWWLIDGFPKHKNHFVAQGDRISHLCTRCPQAQLQQTPLRQIQLQEDDAECKQGLS